MDNICEPDQQSCEEQAAAEAQRLAAERKTALVQFLVTPLSANLLSKVRKRNSSKAGMLGALWSEFIDLPRGDQLAALEGARYKGMAWNSLMQCNPFRCVM
jgi:hypothetical protein